MSLSDQKLHAMGRLSAGQMSVLHRVAQHKSSKEIARELDISPHTVDQRVRRIHSILGVSTRSEAARVYMAAHNSLEEVDADLCGGLIYQGPSLSEPHLSAQVGSSFDEWNPESDRAEKFLREAQAPYFAGDLNSQPQLPANQNICHCTYHAAFVARIKCSGRSGRRHFAHFLSLNAKTKTRQISILAAGDSHVK
jgi:DNA-binding CsgD family transcriptional regulator